MTSLVASGSSRFLDFGTYSEYGALFHAKLSAALQYTPASTLSLGLKSRHSALTEQQLRMRFDTASALAIPWVQVWVNQEPVNASWLPYLAA